MRCLLALILVALTQIGSALALGDIDTARPGSVFYRLETENAAACDRACADDGLCMAWDFHDGQCELKAVVPAPQAAPGVISGVSARAPASLRLLTVTPNTSHNTGSETNVVVATLAPGPDISDQLLGGPTGDPPAGENFY